MFVGIASSQAEPIQADFSDIASDPAKYRGKIVRIHAAVSRLIAGPAAHVSSLAIVDESTESECSYIVIDRPQDKCRGVVLHWKLVDIPEDIRQFSLLLEERVEKDSSAEDTKVQLAMMGAILGVQSFESARAVQSPCSAGFCRNCFRYTLKGDFVGKLSYYPDRPSPWNLHMDLVSVENIQKTDELGTRYDVRCYRPEQKKALAIASSNSRVEQAASTGQAKPATKSIKEEPMSQQVRGYVAVQTKLSKLTRVPLRFPRSMPAWADEENPIFAIVESGDTSGYSVQLASSADCLGGNSCHIGQITGSIHAIPTNGGPKIPVTLRNGLKGYFIDTTCGAHCDDSEIQWSEGPYHYSVRFKALDKATLLRITNSAIPTGH
jgi:hypothetical protein